MPNWMSDEDLALESGDKRTCSDCGRTYWVDEWHSCAEGAEASRQASENFDRNYFGSGRMVKRRITVEMEMPDTPVAYESAIQDFSVWYERGEHTENQDDMMQFKWRVVEDKEETF